MIQTQIFRRRNFLRYGSNSLSRFFIGVAISLWLLPLPLGCGRGEGDLDQSQDETLSLEADVEAQLRALGYADFEEVPEEFSSKVGVTLHRPEAASPGLNLFNTRTTNEAFLIDMSGEVVHRWESPSLGGTWHLVELLPNGDVLIIGNDGYLARLDWDSNLLWKEELRAHHDVEAMPNGDIYVFGRDLYDVPVGVGSIIPIVNDSITHISAEREILAESHFYDLFETLVWAPLHKLWILELFGKGRGGDPWDIFHMNSLEYVDRDLGDIDSEGTLLVSARNLNLVAMIDLDSGETIWSWGPGELDGQHNPSVMQNGNILIFDNGLYRKWSRVLELNPSTLEIEWEYRADPPESFYSEGGGAAQELPNGNILITETTKGRVFEVTREGERVWEFFNPDLSKSESGTLERGRIYRMKRIDRSEVSELLGSTSS